MADNKKVDCKYGEKCYQKNSAHHEKYNHPWKHENKLEIPESKQKRSPSPGVNCESTSKKQKTKIEDEKSPSPKLRIESSYKRRSSRSKSKSPNKSPGIKQSVQIADSDSDNSEKNPSASKSEQKEESKDGPAGSKDSGSNQEKLKERAEQKEMDITKEYEEVMKNLSKSNYFEIFQRRVRYSKEAEYQDLLKTPDFIRHKFLVEMPPDFYKFWEFCESIVKNDEKPEEVLEKFGLKLVGPFDYLAGKFHGAEIYEPGDYLRHWRFYYDPPEFQTIFIMNGTEVHFGYWRDDPKDKENLLVARNDSKSNCEFDFIGGNCFEAAL